MHGNWYNQEFSTVLKIWPLAWLHYAMKSYTDIKASWSIKSHLDASAWTNFASPSNHQIPKLLSFHSFNIVKIYLKREHFIFYTFIKKKKKKEKWNTLLQYKSSSEDREWHSRVLINCRWWHTPQQKLATHYTKSILEKSLTFWASFSIC